jgi:hypothetical protein
MSKKSSMLNIDLEVFMLPHRKEVYKNNKTTL